MRCVIKNADGPQRLVFATDDNGDADSSSTYGLAHLSLTIVGKMVAFKEAHVSDNATGSSPSSSGTGGAEEPIFVRSDSQELAGEPQAGHK